jgi:hypothetical protein
MTLRGAALGWHCSPGGESRPNRSIAGRKRFPRSLLDTVAISRRLSLRRSKASPVTSREPGFHVSGVLRVFSDRITILIHRLHGFEPFPRRPAPFGVSPKRAGMTVPQTSVQEQESAEEQLLAGSSGGRTDDASPPTRLTGEDLRLGLIRSGGHFPRGGYGVQHGRGETADEREGASPTSSKVGAVQQVLEGGPTIPQVTRDLDLTESAPRGMGPSRRALTCGFIEAGRTFEAGGPTEALGWKRVIPSCRRRRSWPGRDAGTAARR